MKNCQYKSSNNIGYQVCLNPESIFCGKDVNGCCSYCTAGKEMKPETCSYAFEEEDFFTKETKLCCYRGMPDSKCRCEGVCEFYEPKAYINCMGEKVNKKGEPVMEEAKQMNTITVIEGIGKDAEIITNKNGGKQSKSPFAAYLIDAAFLRDFLYRHEIESEADARIIHVIKLVCNYMLTGDKLFLLIAAGALLDDDVKTIAEIGKVLQEGAEKYEANNWRLIPQESHINHALIHLLAALAGDTQDNHTGHALCRIHMAYSTEPSKDFSYTEYIKKAE